MLTYVAAMTSLTGRGPRWERFQAAASTTILLIVTWGTAAVCIWYCYTTFSRLDRERANAGLPPLTKLSFGLELLFSTVAAEISAIVAGKTLIRVKRLKGGLR